MNNNGKLSFQSVGSGFDVGTGTIGGRTPTWLDYDGDHRLDVIMGNYGGVSRLFHQNANGTFTESHAAAKMNCERFHYAQLMDVNGDGRLDVLCSAEAAFPQKIYDTSTLPWKNCMTTPSLRRSSRSSRALWIPRSRISTMMDTWTCSFWAAWRPTLRPWSRKATRLSRPGRGETRSQFRVRHQR